MNSFIDQLREHFKQAVSSDDYSIQADFVDELLSNNDIQTLDFHYSLLTDSLSNDDLYYEVCRGFENRGATGIRYLMRRFETEKDDQLKGDILTILGKMRTPAVLPLAASLIQNNNRELRYKAIIVLGWTGYLSELPLLDERLQNEPDEELRGYAATAMRQIWFKHSDTKKIILSYYQQALPSEMSDWVCSCIITCTQDMLLRKLGIKETQYGDISGNVQKAIPKAMAALNDFLSTQL